MSDERLRLIQDLLILRGKAHDSGDERAFSVLTRAIDTIKAMEGVGSEPIHPA